MGHTGISECPADQTPVLCIFPNCSTITFCACPFLGVGDEEWEGVSLRSM